MTVGSSFSSLGKAIANKVTYFLPVSGFPEGFRAAAASLAIMGDIKPLLAEIFSMMEDAVCDEEVTSGAGSPEADPLWERDSVGAEAALEETAEIKLAAETGSCSGSLGMMGKKGLEPERARPTGMLLGRAWARRLDILLASGRLVVGLTIWLEEMAVVGVGSMWGTEEDC